MKYIVLYLKKTKKGMSDVDELLWIKGQCMQRRALREQQRQWIGIVCQPVKILFVMNVRARMQI